MLDIAPTLYANILGFDLRMEFGFDEDDGPEADYSLVIEAQMQQPLEWLKGHVHFGERVEAVLSPLSLGEELAGVGDPPAAAIGTMNYIPREVGADGGASLWCEVSVPSAFFESTHRALIESELMGRDRHTSRTLSITVDRALLDWKRDDSFVLIKELEVIVRSPRD